MSKNGRQCQNGSPKRSVIDKMAAMTWSARAVDNMLINSLSAISLQVCIQVMARRVCSCSRMTPVLKPRPSAGQGLWFFHSLPRYQSLWFSTKPIACGKHNNYYLFYWANKLK